MRSATSHELFVTGLQPSLCYPQKAFKGRVDWKKAVADQVFQPFSALPKGRAATQVFQKLKTWSATAFSLRNKSCRQGFSKSWKPGLQRPFHSGQKLQPIQLCTACARRVHVCSGVCTCAGRVHSAFFILGSLKGGWLRRTFEGT